MTVNPQGLSRDIPDPIKRKVRQRCGFGCVICGDAITHYDHMQIGFSEAHVHDADDITLLCGSHHDQKNKNILPNSLVIHHNKNPFCLSKGFAKGPLHFSSIHPEIIIGNISCKNIGTILSVMGERVLYLTPPEAEGAPYLLNALIRNTDGEIILNIVNNEWLTPTDNWDVEAEGPKVSIRNAFRDIALVFRSEAPDKLVFERIHMSHKGFAIDCKLGSCVSIRTPSGLELESGGVDMDGCQLAIEVTENGLCLGVGYGSVRVRSMSFGPASRNPRNKN